MFETSEKIIQIFALPAAQAGSTTYQPVLYGLTDKGRLFVKPWGKDEWILMNDGIPKENS